MSPRSKIRVRRGDGTKRRTCARQTPVVASNRNRNPVWKKVSIGLALCLFAAVPAVAQDVHIAAVVNDGVVTTSDLDNRIVLLLRSSGIQDSPDNRKRMAPRVLRTLIDEKLELQEAKHLKISVTKDEINGSLGAAGKAKQPAKRRIGQVPAESGDRQALVDRPGHRVDDLAKLVQARLAQDVNVSDQEVTDAVKQAKRKRKNAAKQRRRRFSSRSTIRRRKTRSSGLPTSSNNSFIPAAISPASRSNSRNRRPRPMAAH